VATRLQTQTKATLAPVQTGLLQRKCACGGTPGPDGECAECRKKRLQRRSTGQAKASTVPPIVHDVLRSPGQPLDANTRDFMEPRFGHYFSQVRVHTDSQAAESARAVGALAYTVGQHVVFETGQFRPDSLEGQKLLAHELAHTVQQEHLSAGRPYVVAPVNDPLEREALFAESGHSRAITGQSDVKLHRQPVPPPTSVPALTYTTQGPTQYQCGDFSWPVKWQLNGATERTNGFIVQKVKTELLTESCFNVPDHKFEVWWEAWQVKNGRIMSGTSDRESMGDELKVTGTMGSKGSTSMTGAAKFMENYTEPLGWGRLKSAGPLPATDKPPAGWSESGSKYRFIGVSNFACCPALGEQRSSKLITEELDV
jgi:hypothetical protein